MEIIIKLVNTGEDSGSALLVHSDGSGNIVTQALLDVNDVSEVHLRQYEKGHHIELTEMDSEHGTTNANQIEATTNSTVSSQSEIVDTTSLSLEPAVSVGTFTSVSDDAPVAGQGGDFGGAGASSDFGSSDSSSDSSSSSSSD